MICIREKGVETILKIRENPTKFVDKFEDPDASDSEEEGVEPSEEELMTDSESESEGPTIPDFTFPKPIPMRPFKVPKLNFKGKSYHEMIFWDAQLYEPPLTKKLSDKEIKHITEVPLVVINFPCHTQMVERGVKMVTEASSKVYGQAERDAYIRQQIKSRTLIPEYRTKKDIFPLINE